MATKFLIICSDLNLQFAIREALGSAADLVAIDAELAFRDPQIRRASSDTVLLLDAQLPRRSNGPLDRQEQSALWLVQELRKSGIATPALFITSHELGVFELGEYCAPDNRAIALPQLRLTPSILQRFVAMLLRRPTSPETTWNVIEFDVKRTSVKCLLGNREGEMIEWAEASTRMYSAAHQLAIEYATPRFRPGWARRIHDHGALLFRELIVATLGPGLFSHLELSAGGLRNLAFRFRVEDASLYCAPFEATVRLSGLPPMGTEDDFTQNPFVLINAPIARRIKVANLYVATKSQQELRAAKILFIRSQVGENPSGRTGWDIARVPERDPETGRFRLSDFEFRRLENIDRELNDLKALAAKDCTIFNLEVLDLSAFADPRGAEALIVEKLTLNQYDVVHFAGHSLTTRDGLTLLVLPGGKPGQAEGMSVHTFAEGQRPRARDWFISRHVRVVPRTRLPILPSGILHTSSGFAGTSMMNEPLTSPDISTATCSAGSRVAFATRSGQLAAASMNQSTSRHRRSGHPQFLRAAPITGQPNPFASRSTWRLMYEGCLCLGQAAALHEGQHSLVNPAAVVSEISTGHPRHAIEDRAGVNLVCGEYFRNRSNLLIRPSTREP